jgi:ADP-ribose pyrophosphatase
VTYKTLNSETLHKGRVFDLLRDEILYPDGRKAHFDILRHGGAVAILPINAAGDVVFVKQYRHAVGKELIELPAGRLEPGEDPAESAARELQEEIGMAPGTLKLLGEFLVAPGYSDELITLFLATDLSPSSLPQDDDEAIELVFMSPSEALDRVDSGEISDAKSILGILLAR